MALDDAQAERAMEVLERLSEILERIDPDRLLDIIDRLESFMDDQDAGTGF